MICRVVSSFIICGIAFAQDAAIVSANEVIKTMQLETLRPVFDYCQAEVPELETDLSREFDIYTGKFDAAMQRFLQRIPESEMTGMPAPELESLRAQIAEHGRALVDGLKQQDPNELCPQVLINAGNATVESMLTKIEDAYARYQARVKAKQEASQP